MKRVHFLDAAEHQRFYKLRLLFLMEVTRFYGGPAMFIFTCFLAQPDCRNLLPEHCNTIIKPQLCGQRFPLPLLQVDVFRENQGILQQSFQAHQTSQKQLASGLDTNNFIQSFTTKYHHTATENLHQLCGAKISWTSTLAGVSQQFGFAHFLICLQCKISGSSVFSIFSHEVSRHKVKKKRQTPIFENKFRWNWLGGLKGTT